ncbi:MAG: RNA polymerase sigma factor [Clostridia bacterium]|nr:RNA polymerase sigma factor [Clostridia bacterium]
MNEKKKKEYFTNLYNQDFDYVYSYIYARTAGNSQLTEDIVQETFAAAWLSINTFRQRSSSRTWFCAIAKNKLNEHYRKVMRKGKHELQADDELIDFAGDVDIEKVIIDSEARHKILDVMKAINPIYRYVLIMKYMEDMRIKEIARISGKTPKAVDSILQRAKISFKKEYYKSEGRKQK